MTAVIVATSQSERPALAVAHQSALETKRSAVCLNPQETVPWEYSFPPVLGPLPFC
jgi:hypothetical protein